METHKTVMVLSIVGSSLLFVGLLLQAHEAAKRESNVSNISAHTHGDHICVCPECSYEVTAGPYVKCNTMICPMCGARMRALTTGEYRPY